MRRRAEAREAGRGRRGGGAAAVARETLADGGTAALRCLRSGAGLKRAVNTAPPPSPRRGGRSRRPERGSVAGGRRGAGAGLSRRLRRFSELLRLGRVLPRRPRTSPSTPLPPRVPPPSPLPRRQRPGKKLPRKLPQGRRTTTWPPTAAALRLSGCRGGGGRPPCRGACVCGLAAEGGRRGEAGTPVEGLGVAGGGGAEAAATSRLCGTCWKGPLTAAGYLSRRGGGGWLRPLSASASPRGKTGVPVGCKTASEWGRGGNLGTRWPFGLLELG